MSEVFESLSSPANGHGLWATTKNESHLHVIPAEAGIQKNRLDPDFRRHDEGTFKNEHVMHEMVRASKLCVGTGTSSAQDSVKAGHEAAATAVAALAGERPVLIIVFTAPRYELAALLSGIRAVAGAIPLIGATGSGEIVCGRYMGFGAGVAVLALTAGPYRFGIASAASIGGNLDRAGQDIARASRAEAGPSSHAAVMLLADSLLGDLQELVTGIYRVTGPQVPLFGGAASDEQKFLQTFVFHNDQVIERGAAALWIAGDQPLQVVTRHGWEAIGGPMLVTRAEGPEIFEIGGRPAAIAYEERLGLSPGQLTADNFWNTSLYHPFGLLQSDGSVLIRVARSKTDRGTLILQGCVLPSGCVVQVMKGTADTLLDVAEDVAQTALDANRENGVLIAFSCAARATIFGTRTAEESRRLQSAAGSVPTFGMYCCGEFARTMGVLGTHNASLTALAL